MLHYPTLPTSLDKEYVDQGWDCGGQFFIFYNILISGARCLKEGNQSWAQTKRAETGDKGRKSLQ
jgi:hypothetical protein